VPLVGQKIRLFLVGCVIAGHLVPLGAAELKPETVAAFDRYIRATEERRQTIRGMTGSLSSIACLILPDRKPTANFDISRNCKPKKKKEGGKPIQVPGGMIHHWAGVTFIPGATVSRTRAVLQDYYNHQNVYKPSMCDSRSCWSTTETNSRSIYSSTRSRSSPWW
jgi:hypothetical protein